jgi:glycosyltransferase involved in cell wall biosynthesis
VDTWFTMSLRTLERSTNNIIEVRASMQPDLVTIVIPAYNAERYVADAIRSVFCQSYRPLEIVVVDDGSTDSTAKIANLLSTAAPPEVSVVTVRLAKNSGAANALNLGFGKANGEYICWLSADDMYLDRDKTQSQVSAINRSGGLWSYYRDFYSGTMTHARLVRPSYLPPFHHSMRAVEIVRLLDFVFARDCELRLIALLFRNPINGSSIMIRKQCISQYGQFDPILRNVDADADLWMRYSALGAKANAVTGAPVFVREHPSQTSKQGREMRFGSSVTRLRILTALERTNRLLRILKRNAHFLSWFLFRRAFGMPVSAKYISNYILNNRHEFDGITRRFARIGYRNASKQVLGEKIDEDKILSEALRIQESSAMKNFERILRVQRP